MVFFDIIFLGITILTIQMELPIDDSNLKLMDRLYTGIFIFLFLMITEHIFVEIVFKLSNNFMEYLNPKRLSTKSFGIAMVLNIVCLACYLYGSNKDIMVLKKEFCTFINHDQNTCDENHEEHSSYSNFRHFRTGEAHRIHMQLKMINLLRCFILKIPLSNTINKLYLFTYTVHALLLFTTVVNARICKSFSIISPSSCFYYTSTKTII